MTRLASDIREAAKPIFCSACFNSQPVRHIDFDAACDRGYGKAEATQVAMDDLVLCEGCVKEGAEILGMIDAEEWQREKQRLEHEVTTQKRLREQSDRYAGTLEDAVSQRGIHVDHRKRPRQKQEAA